MDWMKRGHGETQNNLREFIQAKKFEPVKGDADNHSREALLSLQHRC
jgi:hypothetical protein